MGVAGRERRPHAAPARRRAAAATGARANATRGVAPLGPLAWLAVSTLAVSIWLVTRPVPIALQNDGGAPSDQSLLESYRALGFRSLVVAEIEARLAGELDAETRARFAAELAGEALRDGRPHDALRLLAPLRTTGWTRELAWAVALRDAGYHEAAFEAFEALAPRDGDADAAEMLDYTAYLSGASASNASRAAS